MSDNDLDGQLESMKMTIVQLSQQIEQINARLADQNSDGTLSEEAQLSIDYLVGLFRRLTELAQNWDKVATDAKTRSKQPAYDHFPAGYWLGVAFGLAKAAHELLALVRQERPELF